MKYFDRYTKWWHSHSILCGFISPRERHFERNSALRIVGWQRTNYQLLSGSQLSYRSRCDRGFGFTKPQDASIDLLVVELTDNDDLWYVWTATTFDCRRMPNRRVGETGLFVKTRGRYRHGGQCVSLQFQWALESYLVFWVRACTKQWSMRRRQLIGLELRLLWRCKACVPETQPNHTDNNLRGNSVGISEFLW